MRTEYRYKIGEVVNETLKIVSQTKLPKGKYKRKAYEVQSLIYPDAPTYIVQESSLLNGSGCAYKSGNRVYEGNSLYTLEWVRPYLVDIEESKTLTHKSGKKIKVKCTNPSCMRIRYMVVNKLINRGFSCRYCNSNIKYPEKFMIAYLEVKGIKYEYQKIFKDLPNRRFDFYVKGIGLIETHGEQHYNREGRNSVWKNAHEKSILSDKDKRIYCKRKEINLVEIDCREPSFDFISNKIQDSILPNIKEAEKNKIKEIIQKNSSYDITGMLKIYNKTESIYSVGKKYKLSPTTVSNIFKRNGINIQEINKKHKEEEVISLYIELKSAVKVASMLSISYNTVYRILEKNKVQPVGLISRYNSKKVLCKTNNKIFDSLQEAREWCNLSSISGIGKVCKGERKSAGKHPVTGEKLTWEYVDNE